MKKKKTNKRLPRYDLGTMKRGLPLGYQPTKGIGSTTFSVEQGQSIEPEVRAMQANRVPNMLNQASQSFQYPLASLQNYIQPTTTMLSATAANAAAANFGKGVLASGGSNVGALNTTISNINKLGANNVLEGGKTVAKGSLGAAGIALNAIGAAYGGYGMYNDIANAGSHRTAADMQNTRSKSTYATAGGNTYDIYGNPNLNAELAYENEARKAKQTSFAINSIGTGASIGGLAGSIIPGLGNLLGTGIGAGVGALIGGLGSLFGFGDNEDEVREEMRNEADATARQNSMAQAVAKSRDLEAHAKYGKSPYGKMDGDKKHGRKSEMLQGPEGYSFGKAQSMIAPNEGLYNTLTMDGNVAEGKGNGDTIPSSISPGDPTVVFSDKLGFAKIANPIIEEQNRLKNIIANASGSSKQKQFQTMMAEKAMENNHQKLLALSEEQNIARNNMKINKYKNGKLPGFELGLIGEYALSALPHLGGLMENIIRQRRAENADTYAPNLYVDDAEGRAAVNQLANLRYDVTPYLRDAQRALNQQNWNVRRNVGLGLGGRAIAQNANFWAYLNNLANVYNAKNEADNKYLAMYADARAKLGAQNRQYKTVGINNQFQWEQQQNAMKEGWLDQVRKDKYTVASSLASDVMRENQYREAIALENKKLGLFNQQIGIDRIKALQGLNNNSTISTNTTIPTNSYYNFVSPSLEELQRLNRLRGGYA